MLPRIPTAWIGLLLLLSPLLLLPACSPDPTAPPPSTTDPDDSILLAEARFASTHNSYAGEARLSLREQLDGGVRGIELDVHDDAFSVAGYRVGHDQPGDEVAFIAGNPDSDALSAWLRLVGRWSEEHPNHAPITLTLDLKDDLTDNPSFAEGNLSRLNEELSVAFGASLYVASRMDASNPPTVGELRGKVLAVLSGEAVNRLAYRRDRGFSPAVAMDASGRVVEVHDDGSGNLWYWTGRRLPTGSVEWLRHGRYDTGEEPAVALNDRGLLVEVHEDPDPQDDTLWYRVGTLTHDLEILWYEDGGIRFPGEDVGIDPTVAFLDPEGAQLREVHRSAHDDVVWHWEGAFDPDTRRIDWGEHAENVHAPYEKTLATAGVRTLRVDTGIDEPFDETTLRYRLDEGDWQRIRFSQRLFVEAQYGGIRLIEDDDPWFFAGPANLQPARNWAEGRRLTGHLVRLWGFNLGIYATDPPVTFPSTDDPFAAWYREYGEGVHFVE